MLTRNELLGAMRRTPLGTADEGAGRIAGNYSKPDAVAFDYTLIDLALRVAGAIQHWAEDKDLDAEESLADRLQALLIGISDVDGNGSITEDEIAVLDAVINTAAAYLRQCNAVDADIAALLETWDVRSAARVRYAVASALAAGMACTDPDTFAFTDDGQTVAMDGILHTVGRAVARGVKVLHWKRPTNHAAGAPLHKMLTAKQLAALGKARRKSHSPAAQAKRLKSLKETANLLGRSNVRTKVHFRRQM